MNVCLIEPSKFVSLTNFVSTISMPPIGLAYIAAAIREEGHNVTVVDGPGSAPRSYHMFKDEVRVRGLTQDQIIENIPSDTQIIGLGCMFTSHWVYVRELVSKIRERFPKAHLLMGGEHVTGFPEFSLEQAPLDTVVMGEGEETIIELLEHVEKNLPLDNVSGLAYKNLKGRIRVNPRRQRIKNIDSIIQPAWDLFDIKKYNEVNQPHGSSQGKFMPMLATRGCPFSCTFCTSPNMWTTEWIPRDHKLVVDEMQEYQNLYDATDFQFEDLTAIVRRDWIIDFCDEIINRKMEVTFQLPSGTRSEGIDFEVAEKLKKAGCHEFSFAPESGDPRVLKEIKKKVNLPSLYDSARSALKAGINVGCFFIIGFPEDDYRSVLKTYAAMVKCAWVGFTNVNLNAYSPQPNTESFKMLQKMGVITEFDDKYLMSLFTFQDFGAKKTSYNSRFGDWELSLMVNFGAFLFYVIYFLRKPYRIIQLFSDLKSSSSSNKSTKMAKSFFKDAFTIVKNKMIKA
ncbi:MAG: B12-binding domain-containing radical SAM protein [Nitrospina sp.]|jgi:anaerobic magnesium-protoporphyrin IX monomethyl ester cyclase|nr:B12-binding domain-containing radical SAM protein [Nitrospina sp.]MBT6601031.1 B12-binding domain-containing radical SAM protein [Nitrospina sp.]